ncbi:MAG: hypothetical protein IBJ18_10260 [Phycisphaerales bacterium]|nr:hypothetical protein [Phycisphaerales bacterium]
MADHAPNRPAAAKPPANDPFYVGYLPAPLSARILAVVLAAALPLVMCVCAVALNALRPPAGDAVWDTAHARTFKGILTARPYPMLTLAEPVGNLPAGETLLIVEMGKFGGGQRAAGFDSQPVEITGYLLDRGGSRMIELDSAADAVRRSTVSFAPPSPPVTLGNRDLLGEIADSKCYLGAMKPGLGVVHRECAERCLRGGIPPALIVHDERGRAAMLILCAPDQSPLNERLAPFAGDVLTLKGDITRRGTLLVMAINPDQIDPTLTSNTSR